MTISVDVGPSTSRTEAPAEQERPSEAVIAAPKETARNRSLDAFRGLFVLLMNFGFTIPHALYADWMYPRQYPPSRGGDYVPLAGLAWRDVTFAAFLFAMAASIPLTMTPRLEERGTGWAVVKVALRRATLLFAFALIIGHSNPFWTNMYSPLGNSVAVVGYLLCFACFTRPPGDWKKSTRIALRVASWLGVAILFSWVSGLFGMEFSISVARRDDIVALLAFSVLAGTLIWLVTREDMVTRLGILALVVALRLASYTPGWVQDFWNSSPVTWLFQFNFLDMLLVVIPGTIAGDLVVAWMKAPSPPARWPEDAWSRLRMAGIALIAFAVGPIVVAGTYNRFVLGTTLWVVALGTLALALTRSPTTSHEKFVSKILPFAFFWVVAGLFLDPVGGGMKKLPGTISYYFAVAGIAMSLFVGIAIFLDILKIGRTVARPLSDVGQNPMMAYMVLPMFVIPLLALSGFYRPDVTTLSAAIVRSALLLFFVVVLVSYLTRRKIFWRS